MLTTVFIISVLMLYSIHSARTQFDENLLASERTAPVIRLTREAEPGGPKATKLTREQIEKIKLVNANVEKLFKVLAICDADNFDAEKIVMPKSFTREEKAMMALTKVEKSGFIRKSNMERFKRIMNNCLKLSKRYQERESEKLSAMSQTSGVYYYDRKELARKLQESPLDNLRERFTKSRDPYRQLRLETIDDSSRAAEWSAPKMKDRKAADPKVGLITMEGDEYRRPHQMFAFF